MKARGILGFILILAIGVLGIYLVLTGGESSAVSLELSRIGEVASGNPFVLEVSFSNNGDTILKNARLSLILPSEVVFLGEDSAQRVREIFVGDVGPGSLGKESFNLIVTQGGEDSKKIEAKLIYATAQNEKVTYEIQSKVEFRASRSAVALDFEAPEQVFSGENFEVKLKYRNQSENALKNLNLRFSYPPIFQFQEANPKPDQGNNLWEIVSLNKGEEREVMVKGSVISQHGSTFEVMAEVNANFSGQTYLIYEKKIEVKVSEAPLLLSVLVNGSTGSPQSGSGNYAARVGETLTYSLVYRNGAGVDLENVIVKAKLIDEMFDFNTLKSQGAFNTFEKTVTWNAGNLPELAKVASGGEGQVEVEIKVKDSFLIRRLSDKNYVLKFQAEITSPTAAPELGEGKLMSVVNLETKIAGLAGVDSKAYFRDAPSGILNVGNFPPKAGQATQYTLHWILKNYATDLENVKVSAVVPFGVRFTGKVKSNSGSDPIFDQSSSQVTWTIPKVAATKGVISDPYESIFQVEATPNANQVGQILDLLGETKLEAQDIFTGVTLTVSDAKLDTNLPDDLTVAESPKTVQP